MTAAIYYLAEVRPGPDDGPELRVFGAEQLTEFLSSNIEHEHYCWDGYDVLRLFRYDGGALAPLTVHGTGMDHGAEDWLYWHYEVCAADAMHSDGAHVADLAFTVCIDGRA